MNDLLEQVEACATCLEAPIHPKKEITEQLGGKYSCEEEWMHVIWVCVHECTWSFLVLPVHGRKTQRRCRGDPWPFWWGVKQSPGGVWDLEVRRLADWPGSSDSGKDLCGTAPGSAPTRKSNNENKLELIIEHNLWYVIIHCKSDSPICKTFSDLNTNQEQKA